MLSSRTDTERLDAMERLATGYGLGWKLRMSNFGRGLRLHETTMPGSNGDIRDAIDQYLDENE